MKNHTRLEKFRRRNRGIALIIVISMVAILTVMTVAMLSLSDTERKSSVKYSAAESAASLADMAVNIVMSQIWDGTNQSKQAVATASPTMGSTAIWASQPGAIRKYTLDGLFYMGYRLYSSHQMVVGPGALESTMSDSNAAPALTWQLQPDTWVDLNEPAVRLHPTSPGDVTKATVTFPILDPRAFLPNDLTNGTVQGASMNVEGFNYQSTGTWGTFGVVPPSAINDPKARLPMPVEWLYVLQDGTLASAAATQGSSGTNGVTFGATVTPASGGTTPNVNCPVVARIAFWTDDESCKLNINTASEPTAWSVPTVNFDLDYSWAVNPPSRFEYQRYPGHPATVALSTVLLPNFRNGGTLGLDGYGFAAVGGSQMSMLSSTQIAAMKNMKERIYGITPKIGSRQSAGAASLTGIGSNEGTVPFWTVSGDPKTYVANPMVGPSGSAGALPARLYASVDDLLYSQSVSAVGSSKGNYRLAQDMVPGVSSGTATNLFPNSFYATNTTSNAGLNPINALERVRGFLTAHSRAPELNMFGYPRVAMWPIADTTTTNYGRAGGIQQFRTVYDNMIAFASSLGTLSNATTPPYTVGNNSYYFTRADNTSPTNDIQNIPRNKLVLQYLYNLLKMNMPNGNLSPGASFTTKYGNDGAAQILTEIFDYIRCTNLYDGVLAMQNAAGTQDPGAFQMSQNNLTDDKWFINRDQQQSNQYTYTPQRVYLKPASSPYADNLNGAFDSALPGHGQVAPIMIKPGTFGNGTATKGFGRFPTVTEVGLAFICTGDGWIDSNSWGKWTAEKDGITFDQATFGGGQPNTNFCGGRTVVRLDQTELALPAAKMKNISDNGAFQTTVTNALPKVKLNPNQLTNKYYSNFPVWDQNGVTADTNLKPFYNYSNSAAQPTAPKDPNDQRFHPGLRQSGLWNHTLEKNHPLAFHQRRVQAMLCLEPTVVAAGWEGIYSDFCITVDGLKGFQVQALTPANNPQDGNGASSVGSSNVTLSIFDAPANQALPLWHSTHSLYDLNGCRVAGASASPYNTAQDRFARPVRTLSTGNAPPDFIDGAAQAAYGKGFQGNPSKYKGGYNFDFVSDFFTVDARQPLVFPGLGKLTIRIYAGQDPTLAQNLVQTIEVDLTPMKNAIIPVPQLVMLSAPAGHWTNTNGILLRTGLVEAPHWWGFNNVGPFNGAVPGRFSGGGALNPAGYSAPSSFNGYIAPILQLPTYGSLIWAVNSPSSLSTTGYIGPQDPANPTNPYYVGAYSGGNPAPTSDLSYGFNVTAPYGQDSVVSFVPTTGDPRIIAAMPSITTANNMWTMHPSTPTDRSSFPSSQQGAPNAFPATVSSGAGGTNYSNWVHHTFSRYNVWGDAGYSSGAKKGQTQQSNLVSGATYDYGPPKSGYVSSTIPDFAAVPIAIKQGQAFGDFDNGVADLRDGGWINKPDEGNSCLQYNDVLGNGTAQNSMKQTIAAYYDWGWESQSAGQSYVTPNRLIASPGVLGSLSTGVPIGGSVNLATSGYGTGWQTLLFHPWVRYQNSTLSGHPGAAKYFNGVDPADHYIMDLFWMPVVEPYAISDAYSTAGKINMNYQMVPFNRYIRRATGMHAVLKGEIMGAFPAQDALYYKHNALTGAPNGYNDAPPGLYGNPATTYYSTPKWSAYGGNGIGVAVTKGTTSSKIWYRKIEPDVVLTGPTWAQSVKGTLGQFEARFECTSTGLGINNTICPPQTWGLFRTASQICEIFLLPRKVQGTSAASTSGLTSGTSGGPSYNTQDGSDSGPTNPYLATDMGTFWQTMGVTGDNTKERPYTNIYAKVTTQSNTFRVHYRVQTLTKARSSDPTVFDSSKDAVTSEYRGSALIERRFDPTTVNVDYTGGNLSSQPPLSNYYSFRVLENKRFLP